MSNVIVHVPHASTHIPDDVMDQFLPDKEMLLAEAYASADLFTDRLAQQVWPQATIVEATVSRIVVDVERYADDTQESMAAVGRGMIYSHTHIGQPLRRALLSDERDSLKVQYYDPHWARLTGLAKGNTLIDLHSYPLDPWSIESNPGGLRPEIDLGTSPGVSDRRWVEDVRTHFEAAGYSVGENTPYAGVIEAGARHAIMIEIRRDVVGKPGESDRWHRLVSALSDMPLPEG